MEFKQICLVLILTFVSLFSCNLYALRIIGQCNLNIKNLNENDFLNTLFKAINDENLNEIQNLFSKYSKEEIEDLINKQIYLWLEDTPMNKEGYLTALHFACIKGNENIVSLLLENGGNPALTLLEMCTGTTRRDAQCKCKNVSC